MPGATPSPAPNPSPSGGSFVVPAVAVVVAGSARFAQVTTYGRANESVPGWRNGSNGVSRFDRSRSWR